MRYPLVDDQIQATGAAYFVRGLGRFFSRARSKRLRSLAALGLLLCLTLAAQTAPPQKTSPPLPGVQEVQKPMDLLKPDVTFSVPGVPDWTIASPNAVWVSNGPKNSISKLDAKTNTVTATVTVGAKPCSGIAYGFGSLWVPDRKSVV